MSTYADALEEMTEGHKEGCWIWYVMPHMLPRGLASENTQFFQIRSREEAVQYLRHPLLSSRLKEINEQVLGHLRNDAPLLELFGSAVDVGKFRKSISTFFLAALWAGLDEPAKLFGELLTLFVAQAGHKGMLGAEAAEDMALPEGVAAPAELSYCCHLIAARWTD
jgi:uncharacterized protein (DUF1810 family)